MTLIQHKYWNIHQQPMPYVQVRYATGCIIARAICIQLVVVAGQNGRKQHHQNVVSTIIVTKLMSAVLESMLKT